MPPTYDSEATETSPFLTHHHSHSRPRMEEARKSDDAHGGLRSDDPELEGLTLYEKKCVLINREMDANGMGRYQWNIWALCGFGYVLDLLWAQAFALVLGPLEQEMGFPGSQSGNIQVCLPPLPNPLPPLRCTAVANRCRLPSPLV